MPKRLKAYKVVCESKSTGDLISYMAHRYGPYSDLLCLTYRPRRRTYPKLKGSKLFIFENLSDAEHEARGSEKNQIWECLVDVIEQHKSHITQQSEPEKCWDNGKIVGGFFFASLPEGTCFCNNLTLIKRVA